MIQDAALKEAEEAVTEHGDGDDGDGLDIEIVDDDAPAPLCTWTKNADEHRRAFVVRLMADSSVDGNILVKNMDAVCQWLKMGTIPSLTKPKKLTAI